MNRFPLMNLNNYILNESNLSRVWQHSQKGFFVISAYLTINQYILNDVNDSYGKVSYDEVQILQKDTSKLTDEEKEMYDMICQDFSKELDEYNISADNQLRKDLNSSTYNLGFIEQIGKYTDTINNITSIEPSYLVPFFDKSYTFDEFERVAQNLMFKYFQQSILLCYPNEDGTYDVGFYYNNGRIDLLQNKIKILDKDSSNEFLSILKYGPHSDRAYQFMELKESLGIQENSCYDLIGFYSNALFGAKEKWINRNSNQIFV